MCGQNSLELINQLSKANLDQYCNKEDLELLIINILDIDRNFLYRENPTLNENQTILLKKFVARRNLGEPLAYILGNKGFWNLDLLINQNVLVPRPETELLVEKVLSFYDSKPLKLLDLGTGSGAIGISIFSERPSWDVYCCDLSYEALQVAIENKNNINNNKYANKWKKQKSEFSNIYGGEAWETFEGKGDFDPEVRAELVAKDERAAIRVQATDLGYSIQGADPYSA